MRSRWKGNSLGSAMLLLCIGIALLLGGSASATSVAVPSFSKQKTYKTGSNGGLTGIADLNGDGFPDLVALEWQHFAVLLNTGHGTFRARSDYQTGPSRSGAIGDVNGDGRPDLLSTTEGNATVSVLLNRGDGSFAARQDVPTGRKPRALATADLNSDGKADVVTANDGGTVSVLLSNGDGTFQAHRDYPVSAAATWQLAVTDLNGDGKPDLVASGDGDDVVWVLLNNGGGTFEPAHEYATAPGDSNSLAVADLNGDGRPDLVTAENGGGDSGAVTVLFNSGDGSFTRRDYAMKGGIIPLFGGPVSASVADLNGDGRPDVVTVDETDDYVPVGLSVLLNRGDGTFTRIDYPVGLGRVGGDFVTIGDLNGDGRPDLVLLDNGTAGFAPYTSRIALLLNKGDGTFQARRDYPAPFFLERVAIGDLNGDGRPDLIGGSVGPDTVSVRLDSPGLCNVQDVRGLTLVAAKAKLRRVNCRVGKVRRIYHTGVKKGRVVSQTPKFGAVLRGGGRVDVVVSKGRKR